MARLFIVDDDADNARQLRCWLQQTLPGRHDIQCFYGLADYRRVRRRQQPDLILVELMRHQSNGFTLAAALVRQSAATVAVLSDRDQQSDHIWAGARGIRHVLGRQSGLPALASQIAELLTAKAAPAAPGSCAPCSRVMPAAALWRQLCVSPQTALLNALAAELQQLPCPAPAYNRPGYSYNSLLAFISDEEVRKALRTFTEQAAPLCAPSQHQWLLAREQLLQHLQPSARSRLLVECQQEWNALWPVMQQPTGVTEACSLGLGQLQHALRFLPAAHAGPACALPDNAPDAAIPPGLAARSRAIEQIQFACVETTSWQTLVVGRCRHMLAKLSSGRYSTAGAVRDLTELALVLRTVADSPCWRPVLDDCLSARYDRHAAAPGTDSEQWLRHIVALMTSCASAGVEGSSDACVTGKLAEGVADTAAASAGAAAGLAPETVLKLQRVMAELNQRLKSAQPLHARMVGMMVSVYKLRHWLWMQCELHAEDRHCPARWHMIITCLYELLCHGVLQSEQLMPDDISDLAVCVQHLLLCSKQHQVPSIHILTNLAALELTVARRLQPGSDAEHHLLAAGLHRLPVPDGIVADLLDDTLLSGTVLSEITHELTLLTDGARRLGVVRVESLARLLLDCYQQLASQSDQLQHKSLRLALGKAHRVLCRVLDQAAAWLPLEQDNGGLSVSGAINDLFRHVDCHGGYLAPPPPNDSPREQSAQPPLQQYQLINRQLRQLLRRPGDLSAYRSLISELLREQQALIAPYLRYQSPG